MDVVQTAGATLVALMATDAWQQARDGVVVLWRRIRPVQAEEVGVALDETREEILAVRQSGDGEGEAVLVRDWDRRLRRILTEDPSAADQLQELLDEVRGSLPESERPAVSSPVFHTHVSGSGRVYNAGRDQNFNDQ